MALKISEFKQRGAFEILFMLSQQDYKITDIIEKIHQQTAYRAINILMNLHLIDFERREFNAKYYFLTDKGKKVAELLKKIEEILQEE